MVENGHGTTKVSILGKESIIVDYGLFDHYIARDLLTNIPSSTYVLVTDANIAPIYASAFSSSFQQCASVLQSTSRLLVYDTIPPGESSKSRTIKATVEDWMFAQG